MKVQILRVRLVVLLAAAALGVGCGGGDRGDAPETTPSAATADSSADGGQDDDGGSSGSPGGSSSAQTFDEQAEAICKRGREKSIADLQRLYRAAGGQAAEEAVVAKAVAAAMVVHLEKAADELEELEGSDEEEAEAEALADALQGDVDAIDRGRSSFTSLAQVEGQLEKSSELAAEYGFEECSFTQ